MPKQLIRSGDRFELGGGLRGFRVETPTATFTDLGTEFAIEVDDDETARPAPSHLVRSMPRDSANDTRAAAAVHRTSPPKSIAGIYPQLVCANLEGECGIGAAVPWADRLWVITYALHRPGGSSDKL